MKEERIAIIAASSLLPGSLTEAEFWQNLSDGRDCTSDATAADLGGDPAWFLGQVGDSDKAYNFRGGYVREPRVTEASTGVSAETFAALGRRGPHARGCNQRG
jgi:acyl transferase domain-containing protein